MHLNFYLFNKDTVEFEQALNPEKFDGFAAYEQVGFRKKAPFEGRAYVQRNRPAVPDWVPYVSEYLNIDKNLRNVYSSLVVLAKVNGRILATTKGYGHTALDRTKFEKRFGLQVVLNAIDPDKIGMIDTRSLDLTTKQKRVLLGKTSPLYDFDFDIDSDLLKLISGKPTDEGVAKRLSGSDSLKLSADVRFEEIGTKCTQLLDLYAKDTYKERFSFIDDLRTITDEDLIEELDQELVSAINNRATDKLILAYPELFEWEKIVSFHVEFGASETSHIFEIDLAEIYGFLNGLPKLQNAYDVKITGVDDMGRKATGTYTLHEFCVYELQYKDRKYLLSLSNWFQISDGYLSTIEKFISEIEELPLGFLPEMIDGQSEGEYNASVAENDKNFILLDKKNYPAGGYSKIEVCDLLGRRAEFICVKKYNSSSSLSHLFAQGSVSCDCLIGLPEYRKFILDKAAAFQLPFTESKLEDRGNITYIFAIATPQERKIGDVLPFFSKVNLKNTVNQMVHLGFKVKLLRISMAAPE